MNRNGATELHLAVQRNDTRVVSLLLMRGAAVNARDVVGNTPLHHASMVVDTLDQQIITSLVLAGANLAYTNAAGRTAAQLATNFSFADMLQRGLETKQKTRAGRIAALIYRRTGAPCTRNGHMRSARRFVDISTHVHTADQWR